MTTDLKSRLLELPGATELIQQRDGFWMSAPRLDVLSAASQMLEAGARLSTITAAALPDEETEVIYHYYFDHQAFNFKVTTQKNTIPSISSVLPAADWIEREIQDLYKVQFTGHPHPDRLIRPVQLEPGLFRQPGGKQKR
jgi:NADH:ubiquinone oxidoreductase subunit C